MVLSFLYLFIIGFLLTGLLLHIFRVTAVRFNIVDMPDAHRKKHAAPMPLLGGVALFFSFVLLGIHQSVIARSMEYWHGVSVAAIFSIRQLALFSQLQFLVMLTGGFFLVLLGVIDDIFYLKARTKFFFQCVIAVVLYYAGIRIYLPGLPDGILLLVTVVWIVGITNAFNLLDNMDGLSAGVACIAGCFFLLQAIYIEQWGIAALLTMFCAALCAFLRINFPAARMFMGDAGSLFLGYILSLISIAHMTYNSTVSGIAVYMVPVLILAVPIYETLALMYSRHRRGISIFAAENSHFSHRLLTRGFSRFEAVMFIYLLQFAAGMAAFSLQYYQHHAGVTAVLAAATIVFLLFVVLGARQRATPLPAQDGAATRRRRTGVISSTIHPDAGDVISCASNYTR